MNGHWWKTIAAGISIAAVAALWAGNARLASVETSQHHLTRQIETLASEVKENRRLLFRNRFHNHEKPADRLGARR